MKLEVLPARKGDCLMIHTGSGADRGLILIDGGPAGVWQDDLENRLLALRTERGLGEQEPLVIDLAIVSHVDDDHINGMLRLLESMKRRHDRNEAPQFRIDRLWHNSFDNILGNDETVRLARSSQYGAASTAEAAEALVDEHEHGAEWDTAFILASVKQGDDLRRLALALDIPINPDVDSTLICVPEEGSLQIEVNGINFTVIGPRHEELVELQTEHDDWLKDHPERQRSPAAFLAALEDESVANLSSIVLLAEKDGRSILLTGDARSDHIMSGLEKAGLLSDGGGFEVDILKMPHHGSIRNIDEHFVRRVIATDYVFSGDGKHGNPDRDTFELLLAERPGAAMTFHLTYPIDQIDPERKRDYDKERNKLIRKRRPAPPEWSDGANSLKSILDPEPAGVAVNARGDAPMIL